MYIMYVDESGDSGLPPPRGTSPTMLYCLTGLVVHELRWLETLQGFLQFRHRLKNKYGVYLDDELHSAEMFSKPTELPASLRKLKKHERLAIIRHHADQIAASSAIRLINVCVDKRRGKDADSDAVFKRAWYALFQRFENTIQRRNFPGPPNDHERGIVFPDATDARRLVPCEEENFSHPFGGIGTGSRYVNRFPSPCRIALGVHLWRWTSTHQTRRRGRVDQTTAAASMAAARRTKL